MVDQPRPETAGKTDREPKADRLPLLQSLLKSWAGPEYSLGEIAQATPWAAAIFAIQVLKGAAPIMIVLGVAIYGVSFIEGSIREARISAQNQVTEIRKEAQGELNDQIKAFNDLTTAMSSQLMNVSKMQDLQQQLSSQLMAATDARLAAQKAEHEADSRRQEAEHQMKLAESQATELQQKLDELNKALLSVTEPESVTPEMFATRDQLMRDIDGLDAPKARALVAKIEAEYPEFKQLAELQYPQDVRDGDKTGDKAKKLLKRAVVLTVRTTADAAKWQSETKEPLAAEITDEQIRQLIDLRTRMGATSCKVVSENNQRLIVCLRLHTE